MLDGLDVCASTRFGGQQHKLPSSLKSKKQPHVLKKGDTLEINKGGERHSFKNEEVFNCCSTTNRLGTTALDRLTPLPATSTDEFGVLHLVIS